MIDDATKTVVVLRVTNIEIYCFMENNQQQILSEIKTLMASVRSQWEELDAKIVQWQQIVEPNEVIDVTSVIDGVEFYVDAPKRPMTTSRSLTSVRRMLWKRNLLSRCRS